MPFPGTWRVFEELAFGRDDDVVAVEEPVACWYDGGASAGIPSSFAMFDCVPGGELS